MGPLGYGGTRYMPLHFALHGVLINTMNDPVIAGSILTGTSAAGLLTGVFALLRALGVSRNWAVCGAVLSLASIASQLAITTIRGDLLPAALNAWGLALLARQRGRDSIHVGVPVLLFVLAFSAKITTLFGLAASISTLILARHVKCAVRMGLAAAAGMLVCVAAIFWASDGRVVESMRVCGSGGAGMADILKAPLKFGLFACTDLGFLPFFLAASLGVATVRRASFRELPAQYFLWTLAATVLIFGSPGIDFNHLLDLHVAGVVLLVVLANQASLAPIARRLLSISGFVSSAAILIVCGIALYAFPEPLQRDRINAFNAAKGTSGPVLSEDPWVPVIGGDTPYVLDAFNLRLASANDPRVRDDLWSRIEAQFFSGVVLTPIENRETGEFELDGAWLGVTHYGGLHFPPGFVEKVFQHYEPVARFHSYLVLKPKAGDGPRQSSSSPK